MLKEILQLFKQLDLRLILEKLKKGSHATQNCHRFHNKDNNICSNLLLESLMMARIMLWNANGLWKQLPTFENFLNEPYIDLALLNEL